MFLLFLFLFFLILAAACWKLIPPHITKRVVSPDRSGYIDKKIPLLYARIGGSALCVVLALLCMISTSIFYVGSDETAHLERIYFGDELPQDQIIAAPWQKGPQAKIYGPGFHYETFIKVWYDVKMLPVFIVEDGKAGVLMAKDGRPMPADQAFAPLWDEDEKGKMIDAEYFLGFDKGKENYKGPRGIKGPQATAVGPGKYRVNRYLWDTDLKDAWDVPKGYVAVVKANFGKKYTGEPILPEGLKSTNLSVPIVPKGYQGVWAEVLEPNRYYLNLEAMNVFNIPTQVQNLSYIGGYKRRFIDLVITDKGEIIQKERAEEIKMPPGAADMAILLRVENWDVFQDVRLQIQVKPENAPYLVASVGGLEEAENKILTPDLRSILRDEVAKQVEFEDVDSKGNKVVKHRPRRVLDLLYRRTETQNSVLKPMTTAANTVGIHVVGVRFGDPVVPPELLIPGKRKQLAEQLIATYKQEKEAQEQRVQTEKKRAEADQQPELMRSEIGIVVAENEATARRKKGLGEKAYLEAIAAGQNAQKKVLGDEKTFELAYLKEVLQAYVEVAKINPDAIKMPYTLVAGEKNDLAGAAAIFGHNNITMSLNGKNDKEKIAKTSQ
jgi:regulator of protease activity HflC (stomatin/prohibitin superfamily)